MPEPRVAIYARHGSDKQNPLSSKNLAAACRALVERLGGRLIGTYADPEIPGYRRDRPGLMRQLGEMRDGRVDVTVCERLDRIARDCEDISRIGRELRLDRIRLATATEGEIDDVKLPVAGLLGSMFLPSLRYKTLQGEAAVLAGRFGGRRVYGYRRRSVGAGRRSRLLGRPRNRGRGRPRALRRVRVRQVGDRARDRAERARRAGGCGGRRRSGSRDRGPAAHAGQPTRSAGATSSGPRQVQ